MTVSWSKVSEATSVVLDGTEIVPIVASGVKGRTTTQAIADLAADVANMLETSDIGVTVQAYDADLTSIAALTTTAAGRSVLTITDPNADRILAWDDSVGAVVPIALADVATETTPVAGDDYILMYHSGALSRMGWDDLLRGVGYYKFLAVADNTAVSIDLGADAFGALMTVWTNNVSDGRGTHWCRAANSPAISAMGDITGSIGASTGVLTGTTGTDGRINVACDDNGLFYVENRIGANRVIYVHIRSF